MATMDTLRSLEHEILHNEDLRSREVFLAALRSLQHEQQRAQTAENALAQERQRASAAEERAMHSYARRTHNTLTAAVDKSSQLFNALSHSHPKSIVNQREQKLQPGIAVLDVSACPKQRRIYGSERPRLYKMIEGQRDKHVNPTIKELEKEGGFVVRSWQYYPNGITHRDNLKRNLDDWLQEQCGARAKEVASFIKIAVYGFNPDCGFDAERFLGYFDMIVDEAVRMPVEYGREAYPIEAVPVARFLVEAQ
ncbi:hypothetical protein FI667_g8958, partial [Globisporangium splendens]